MSVLNNFFFYNLLLFNINKKQKIKIALIIILICQHLQNHKTFIWHTWIQLKRQHSWNKSHVKKSTIGIQKKKNTENIAKNEKKILDNCMPSHKELMFLLGHDHTYILTKLKADRPNIEKHKFLHWHKIIHFCNKCS